MGSLARKRGGRLGTNDGWGTVERRDLKTRHHGTIRLSAITWTYLPSLTKNKKRVEFCWRGARKLIHRHDGSSARRRAPRLAGGDQGRAGQRGFPFRIPHRRSAASDPGRRAPVRGGPLTMSGCAQYRT